MSCYQKYYGNLFLKSLAAVTLLAAHAVGQGADVVFEKDILPLLEKHCIDCHGPDTAESNLRLDSMVHALRGGDSGEPAIVPGKSEQSYLLVRVLHEDTSKRMPPDSPPLAEEDVTLLKRWVNNASAWSTAQAEVGTKTLDHWSFQPVVRPELPVPGEHPVDAFILAKLRESNLTPSEPAERRTLIRRLYLVMLGLPPTPQQVERFVNDKRDNAWELLVDEVLANPHYGERWATHWLDLVRFGETHGFETNRERPNAWHYRDWVIDALNSDKPYDQFVLEQIAGDAVGADIGTGFLVAGPYDLVKGADPKLRQMQRQDELADMINTTGTAFLGLTLGCARCHNHKFDPVSQSDYYAMQAVFAGVNHADRALPLSEEAQQQLVVLDKQIAELREQLSQFIPRTSLAAHLFDDDKQSSAKTIEYVTEPAGQGKNPGGTERGFASDAGSESHSVNVSGGAYTWWKNVPGQVVAAYRPQVSGRYRVWISWGSGHASHTKDAQYLLDTDGQINSTEDRTQLAVVDQQRFSDGSGDVPGKSLWSGFFNAGVHELSTEQAILVAGGSTGSAVTSDVLLLEPVTDQSLADAEPSMPRIRGAVNARENVEYVAPIAVRQVRFTINRTNQSQPCIDELQIYSGGENVALASAGAVPSSSGDFVHEKHKLKHINDGKVGNSHSWIASTDSNCWVQIDLPAVTTIDRIVWGRDREQQFSDRLAIDYRIEGAVDGENWALLASSTDRMPYQSGGSTPEALVYEFDSFPEQQASEGREWLARLNKLTAQRDAIATTTSVYAGTFSQPGPTHRLYRGEPDAPREQVSPAAIKSLTELSLAADAPEQQRRLKVAEWIASKDNPLTARVIVNRLWQFQFGTGIVDTPSDFGGNGTPPSHPELLDWLASELMEHDWSLKHIHRVLLTSKTWQQDSRPNAAGLAVDAGARLLWRFPPRRLEAEGIRDCMLAATGKLNLEMGGPGFSAFEVEAENVRHYHPKKDFGPEDWRRMIYMTKVRQERDAVFGVFDCPDCSQVVPKRSRSTTPLQALNLLNSRFVMQQAQLLVERLDREAATPEAKVELAWQLCFGRPAEAEEVKASLAFVHDADWQQFARALLNSNEFVFIP